MQVSVLSTVDPMVRDVAAMSVSDSCAVLLVSLSEDTATLDMQLPGGPSISESVRLDHPCISCSIRLAVVPFLEQWDESVDSVLLALPVAVESVNVVPSLSDALAQAPGLRGSYVSSVVHVTAVDHLAEDLLSHVPLGARGLDMFEGDDRCVGEVLAMDIGHADVLVTIGSDPLARELVEHLRPHDSELIPGLALLTRDLLFEGRHDVEAGIERVHPATVAAWGGPTDQGVWTLDLHSERPFDPERLAANIARMSPEGVCVRGCFWLPSRPRTVCTWNSHGSAVSIGTAGEWDGDPFTHLIVTGVGDAGSALDRLFGQTLIGRGEMSRLLDWAGISDGLEDWFPQD